MKKYIVNLMFAGVGLLPLQGLQASEVGFMGGFGFQLKQLYMEQNFKGVAELEQPSGDLSATIGVLNLQGVVFYEAMYIALKYEMGLSNDAFDSDIPYTGEATGLYTEVTRNDISLAIGLKLNEKITVFGGYMAGETELTPEAIGDCPRVVATDPCFNSASKMLHDGFGEYRQEYIEKGFFVGVSTGWDVAPGRVNASLAYALMDGEYSDNYQDMEAAINFDYRGDSQGVSGAVSWLAPLTDSLAYFVDFRVQNYDMNAKDYSNAPRFDGSRVETTETIVGLTAGLQMVF